MKSSSIDNNEYTTEERVVYKTVKKKRFKVKIPTIILTLIIIFLLYELIVYLINKPISNIYVSGNKLYSDWDIIEKAKLDDYPLFLKYPNHKIKKNLEKDPLILNAKITRRYFTRIYIDITENRPLFYDDVKEKVILGDGTLYKGEFNLPTLVNSIPDEIYNDLIKKMKNIDDSVFVKISEIKYEPDEVDNERFLLTMIDGNYVYLTLLKFDIINDYNDIVKTFDNKKGILYLNSGGYFKILQG